MKIVCRSIRFGLAALFLLAGFTKLPDSAAFADSIAAFRVFPDWSINALALIVPILEIATSALLISPWWKRRGALLALILSGVFLGLFLGVSLRGQEVNCSCFGTLKILGVGTWAGMMRAAIMVAASGMLYVAELRSGMRRLTSPCRAARTDGETESP